jgi:hypothetical protein
MRHLVVVPLALFAAGLIGCFPSRSEQSPPSLAAPARFEGPTGDDIVQMDLAIVERPCGDHFLNHELWELADEQGVNLERKPILEQNGFRVCQIGGLPPAGLQRLLASRRSCPDPRLVRRHAGDPMPVLLGPVWPRCAFCLDLDHEEEVALDNAQCLLEVVPALADEGRILLRFTPHVRHGRPIMMRGSARAPDGTLDWSACVKQPEEAYPALSWELTVGPSEYVVVGTRLDRPNSLGHRCLVGEGVPRMQRLLVLRAARAPSGPPSDEAIGRSPPLAAQAGWPSARGTAP